MQVEEICQLLRGTTFGQNLSDPELVRLVAAGNFSQVDAGTVLMQEGGESGSVVILLDGEAEILKGDLAAKPHLIRVLGQGAVLGELGLVLNIPRTCSVRTTCPTRIFVLDRPSFQQLMDAGDTAGVKLCLHLSRVLASRVESLTEEIAKMMDQNDGLLDAIDDLKQESLHQQQGIVEKNLLQQADELRASNTRLRQQFNIEIDQSKREKQVAEITQTDYFKQLQARAKHLRQRNAE